MKGRIERQLEVEKSIENRIDKKMPILRSFYYSTDYMSYNSRSILINNLIRFLKYCEEEFGLKFESEKDFESITTDQINQYIYTISRKKDGSGTLKQGTICTVISHLTTFFSYLRTKGAIMQNPTDVMVKRPKVPKKETITYLEPEEIRQMFYNIDHSIGDFINPTARKKWKSRDRAFIALLLITGVRIGALIQANMEDLSLDEQTLLLTDKGNKTRVYHIDDDTMGYINMWLRRRDKILSEMGEDSEYLFFSNHGGRIKRIDSYNMTIVIREYTAFTGKHITAHKLRSTTGTMVYRKTKDIYKVADVLNHADVSTSQIYAQQDQNNRKDAADFMSGLITGKEKI